MRIDAVFKTDARIVWIVIQINFLGRIMATVFVVVYMNCASVTTNKFEDVAPRGGRICILVITVNLVQQDFKSNVLDAAFADDPIG